MTFTQSHHLNTFEKLPVHNNNYGAHYNFVSANNAVNQNIQMCVTSHLQTQPF